MNCVFLYIRLFPHKTKFFMHATRMPLYIVYSNFLAHYNAIIFVFLHEWTGHYVFKYQMTKKYPTRVAVAPLYHFSRRGRSYGGNNNAYVCLHDKFPIFLRHFKRIWILSTDLYKNPHDQISRKFVYWVPRSCMRTDGQTYVIGAMRTRLQFNQLQHNLGTKLRAQFCEALRLTMSKRILCWVPGMKSVSVSSVP